MRHLPEVAQRQNVSIEQVRRAWNQLVVPKVRFVPLDPRIVDDPRVADVQRLDTPDSRIKLVWSAECCDGAVRCSLWDSTLDS